MSDSETDEGLELPTSNCDEDSDACFEEIEKKNEASLPSTDSAIEIETTIGKESCSLACWCRQLRQWLNHHSDRSHSILALDTLSNQNQNEDNLQSFPEPSSQSNLDPLPTLSGSIFTFAGPKDRLGRPDGHCTLYFPNGRKFNGEFVAGQRSGDGTLHDKDGSIVLTGTYVKDRLHGIAHIISGSDASVLEVIFVNGFAHGPARRFSSTGQLIWVGRYRNGQAWGLCWKSGDGRGWTCGLTDGIGKIHDANAIYLYPNFHNGLQGEWRHDLMKKSKFVNVVGFHIVGGFPLPNPTPTGDNQEYTYDLSSFDKISSTPKIRDPYEALCVACRKSKVDHAGEGIFAVRNLPANAIVAFYNGVRFNDCHAFNDWDTNSYKIRLSEKKKQILDIPPECQKLGNYSATLAHKINHSFNPNAKFVDFLHPRFGRIVAVKTTCSIQKGNEIFCHYGYNPSDCPYWYKILYDANARKESSRIAVKKETSLN